MQQFQFQYFSLPQYGQLQNDQIDPIHHHHHHHQMPQFNDRMIAPSIPLSMSNDLNLKMFSYQLQKYHLQVKEIEEAVVRQQEHVKYLISRQDMNSFQPVETPPFIDSFRSSRQVLDMFAHGKSIPSQEEVYFSYPYHTQLPLLQRQQSQYKEPPAIRTEQDSSILQRAKKMSNNHSETTNTEYTITNVAKKDQFQKVEKANFCGIKVVPKNQYEFGQQNFKGIADYFQYQWEFNPQSLRKSDILSEIFRLKSPSTVPNELAKEGGIQNQNTNKSPDQSNSTIINQNEARSRVQKRPQEPQFYTKYEEVEEETGSDLIKSLPQYNDEKAKKDILNQVELYLADNLCTSGVSKKTRRALVVGGKRRQNDSTISFEDIKSCVRVECKSKVRMLEVQKIIEQSLESFKTNHKVYFKKVRSQKEMIKDTKFHNLNKRIMRVLLSMLTHKRLIDLLEIPEAVQHFFAQMSASLIQSAKKLIKNTIINDQYSHAHYNTMFLQISQANYLQLQKSASDQELHELIYNLDLSKPYSDNTYLISKTNILKQYVFLVLQHTLQLNPTENDSNIQAIRSMYIDRVLHGMEKMNTGTVVQRF